VVTAPPTPFVPPLAVGEPVPAVALRDQRGRRFVLGERHGAATAVAFVYTRCREAGECPAVSAKFARLQATTRANELSLVEITVDPEHDTPAALARYGAIFGADPARWTLATGAPADVVVLERRFGVEASIKPDGEIAHSDTLVLLDPQGRVAEAIGDATWTPDQVAAEARALDGKPGNALARWAAELTRGVSGFCGGTTGGIANWVVLVVLCCSLAVFGYAFRRVIRIPA
jgi:cytochrome oxidase Cu insertion factor (SCO1/SenC/PrrC family)